MREIPGNEHLQFNAPPKWAGLFEIGLVEPFYLTPCPGGITADGHDYQPYPILIEDLSQNGQGEISTIRMTVGNVEGLLSQSLQNNNAVDGQPVTFKVWSFDQAAVIREDTLEIIKVASITSQAIVFDLGTFNPFTAKLLSEKFLHDFCWNRYKGAGCWIRYANGTYAMPYGFATGTPDTCNRNMADCDRHNNVLRINTFPGIPGGGGFV